MTKNSWVFLNGYFYPEHRAYISITDRGFLFGEGVFTTIRVTNGRCEFLSEHLYRLKAQCRQLALSYQFIDVDWIDQLIALQQATSGTWRLKIIITAQTLLLTLHPFSSLANHPCHLCLFPFPLESPLAHLKTLSYLDRLIAKQYAKQQRADSAVICNKEKVMLEAAHANVFWFIDQRCFIPDPILPYLYGILIQSLSPYLPHPIVFVKSRLDELPAYANIYMCNTLHHLRPVLSIQGHLFSRNLAQERQLNSLIAEICFQ